MTDEVLGLMASKVMKTEDDLARDIGLDPAAVSRSRLDPKHIKRNMLFEWRESDLAIDLGLEALDALKTMCM